MTYDCIIIGGGIAGLQAAIQLGRYEHNVLVVDSNHGRSSLCRSYHNVLGWPDGVSGQDLRTVGRQQARSLGVEFVDDEASDASRIDGTFVIGGKTGAKYEGKRLLIATGLVDRIAVLPGLFPCLGTSVYVCPDCDGYEVRQRRTLVLGAGDVGANMALMLTWWTNEIVYINHEQSEVDQKLLEQLKEKRITYVPTPIQEVLADGERFQGVVLHGGENVMGDCGFIAFGGNSVRSYIAAQLGVHILDNKHIEVNPRTKMTNVENVWAAGDVVAHSEQVTVAMGDGSQAAIWIHKSLVE